MYVDGPVSYQGPFSPSESLTNIVIPKIEACSCVITWSGQALTSRITNTELRLIGRVVPATNLKKEADHNNRWHIAGSLPNDSNGANVAIRYCYIDVEDAYIGMPLLCFEVSITK